jgi:hypothetical protein
LTARIFKSVTICAALPSPISSTNIEFNAHTGTISANWNSPSGLLVKKGESRSREEPLESDHKQMYETINDLRLPSVSLFAKRSSISKSQIFATVRSFSSHPGALLWTRLY